MTTITHCRTCGFTDCPSLTEGGPCPRWTNAATARIPLVPEDMPEGTPSARRYGAEILGRALAHEAEADGRHGMPRTMAVSLGFTHPESFITRRAYLDLLGG